jgi:hypothetical protein
MELNQIYSGNNGSVFKITGLELRENDPWVTYINTQTLQEHSCRQEAFLSRFSLLPQPR